MSDESKPDESKSGTPRKKTFESFPAPKKIKINISPVEEDNRRTIDFIVNTAYERIQKRLATTLAQLPSERVTQVNIAAEAHGYDDPAMYLSHKIQELEKLYLGYRTGLIYVRDNDTGKNVILANVSAKASEIYDCLGLQLGAQIYRTTASSVDEVLNEQYGKSR